MILERKVFYKLIEDFMHITYNYLEISVNFYLPKQHNAMTKALYKSHILKRFPDDNFTENPEPEYFPK